MEASERTAAVFFVGNRLMLDDGVGPAAYDEILAGYDIPENVTLVDVGCMSLDMLPYVERCDLILTVDAVDGTATRRAPCTGLSRMPWRAFRPRGVAARFEARRPVRRRIAHGLRGRGLLPGHAGGQPLPGAVCRGPHPRMLRCAAFAS